ncbi:homocitrate synthase [Calderihabitans maritimus]|uniref:Homocitrate synthase NifV n=1 Tax=Calderihabitans maritimus TaxID=1246530 RepID=A0A1Z5HX31_9FIRM|nr:homocitrate synthase [Calderihabitans maritimus]GAW93891.1 homocitrate synthase NifV [Calderihabitans maritimus]
MQRPLIIDVTLRDGEQAPGVVFSIEEKVLIARLLDRVGVYQIEAGIPAMGEIEQEAIRTIAALGLQSRVSTWNRLLLTDIRASLACGVRDIHICAPISEIHIRYKLHQSHRWVLARLKEALSYALAHGCRVTVGAEDASRAEESFLVEFALVSQELGAERLRYCDTVGILDPFTTFERLSRLREKVAIPLEFHGHNDFGMATANTLAAVKAGCSYVDVTVGGLGERAGNTSLEELAAALKGIYGTELGLGDRVLQLLSRYVARAANRVSTQAEYKLRTGHRPSAYKALTTQPIQPIENMLRVERR